MTEFTEVWKQWTRMCGAHEDCSECPMRKLGCNLEFPCKQTYYSPDLIEFIVTEWAKKNPEKVYPTFGEWLEKQGIVKLFNSDRYEEDGRKVYLLLESVNNQIPAYIAEKLGLEPKEG